MYSISTCGYKLWLLRCKQNEFEYFEKKAKFVQNYSF